jgi:hypothetical protein
MAKIKRGYQNAQETKKRASLRYVTVEVENVYNQTVERFWWFYFENFDTRGIFKNNVNFKISLENI